MVVAERFTMAFWNETESGFGYDSSGGCVEVQSQKVEEEGVGNFEGLLMVDVFNGGRGRGMACETESDTWRLIWWRPRMMMKGSGVGGCGGAVW